MITQTTNNIVARRGFITWRQRILPILTNNLGSHSSSRIFINANVDKNYDSMIMFMFVPRLPFSLIPFAAIKSIENKI